MFSGRANLPEQLPAGWLMISLRDCISRNSGQSVKREELGGFKPLLGQTWRVMHDEAFLGVYTAERRLN